MPQTVFDAVGKFFADTSNLDEFTTKLERGLPTAADKAAVSTQLLKAAQLEFRDAIKAVSTEGGNTVENLNRLAEAEKNLTLASAAAKEEHAALKAELAGTSEASGIAAQATEELTGKLTSMFGLIAAFEGFKSLIEGTQTSVLNLELLSQKTGIAIDTLAGIQHVSEAAGVQFDEVSTALTRLARAQVLAIEGGKQQVAAFERIGISANELKALSPEQLFYRVADAMANSSSHAAAAASAFALLGRGGAALIPIFQQSTEALRAQVEEAARNSGVTKEAGESAREWEVQVANITEAFRAGMIPIMQVSVPVIKGVETAVSALALGIRDLASIVGGVSLSVFDSFKSMGTLVSDVLAGDWKKLVSDAKSTAGQVKDDLGGIGVQFKDNWQHTTEAIKQTWTTVNPLKQAKDDLSDLGNTKGNAALQKMLEARIIAEKEAADAEIDLQLQKNRALLGADQDNYANQLKLQAIANAGKYDNAKRALNDQIELALSEGEKGRAQAIKLFGELDKLEDEHRVKALKNWNDFQKELHMIMSEPIPLVNALPPGMDRVQNQITKGFDQARAAAQALGITLHIDLKASLDSAYDNYAKLLQLFKQGIGTQKDLDNAYIAQVKAQLNFAKATGASKDAVQKLEQQLKDLGAVQDHVLVYGKKSWDRFFADVTAGSLSTGTAVHTLGHLVADGIGASVAAAITGSQGFAAAFEQMAKSAIAALAEHAIVKALEEVAYGFSDLANPLMAWHAPTHFLAAAEWGAVGGAATAVGVALPGGSSKSSSSSRGSGGTTGPSANSPNVNANSGPSQVVNVTHFADGGIATQPMLAMVAEGGKASEEAIIPLHDNNAIQKIASAFMEPIQRLARLNPALSVPSSLIYPEQGVQSSGSFSGAVSRHDIQELTKALKKSPGMSHVNVTIEGDLPLLVTKITHGTKTGRLRLHSTTTDKTIRKA